jgi:hypothetical protein
VVADTVEFTRQECKALYELLAMSTGHNPEYVFSYFADGTPDDPEDVEVQACVKLFKAAGARVPPHLE